MAVTGTIASTRPASALSEAEHRGQLRRAILAGMIGTTIEWYDFFLYSTVTGLVFAKLFFPESDRLVGTLEAFSVYALGFVARPLGAAIFGHYGDRIGRKSALIATLLLMGIATFLVAFVPGYEIIGIWGAVILTILRVVQGIGVGGEWGGSVLLAMEWARTNQHRGFVASWPQLGVPAGLFLANFAVLGFSALSGDGFASWGWRVPFAISIVLVGLGLWIRLGIQETPAFRAVREKGSVERAPVAEVLRRHPREVVLTALARMGEQAPFYIFTAFVFSYGVGELKLSRDLLLSAVLGASLVSLVTIPLSGWLSDRFGRRRIYMVGAALTGLYAFVYFALLQTLSPPLVFVAIVLSLVPHDLMYGPQAALIAECFPGRLRYSGASLGYQLASILAGGPAPLIATALLAQTHSGYAIAAFIAICAVISLIATALLADHTNRDIDSR
ncbi:MFS transporter [Methylobacterium sp. NEAU 140]|uniref:MFS transporter n=1 Tax=Methylobacterium sp. NEAU 140 TaxID=3064945 RepID=UPI002734C5F2|nr:MFS transporter [Methylobacterium sp. NEAU 140]MDP4024566.1 MFS transporter [Methylobacterium sp. NEAU 140]